MTTHDRQEQEDIKYRNRIREDLKKEILGIIFSEIEEKSCEISGYNLSEDKERIDDLTLGEIKEKASDLFGIIQDMRIKYFRDNEEIKKAIGEIK